MKETALRQLPKLCRSFLLFCFIVLMLRFVCVAQTVPSNAKAVSYVDRNLDIAQKYLLRVDENPFYMTSIQVRLDKLRYSWDIARVAADGFNTVSIPIQWYEVEPAKDKFNWAILDEYLGAAKKYNLKVELLWFGQNSGGHVQWLGDSNKQPAHLRTPDYVRHPTRQ
jgi:hypothetical protein